MRYEIDANNFAVKIYDENNVNFWFQPNYPNGDSFDSYEEAEEWANVAVKSMDKDYNFLPPDGKTTGVKTKPTEQQILESKLTSLGLTVDDLKKLLNLA